jgi:hypothetical protein
VNIKPKANGERKTMTLNETHIQFFGLLFIFYVLATAGFSTFFEVLTKDAAHPKAIMALEFARTEKDVADVVGEKPGAREGLKMFFILGSVYINQLNCSLKCKLN